MIIFRARRSLENKQNLDGDRMSQLEEHLHLAKTSANEAERKYEEVGNFLNFHEMLFETTCRNFGLCGSD